MPLSCTPVSAFAVALSGASADIFSQISPVMLASFCAQWPVSHIPWPRPPWHTEDLLCEGGGVRSTIPFALQQLPRPPLSPPTLGKLLPALICMQKMGHILFHLILYHITTYPGQDSKPWGPHTAKVHPSIYFSRL